MSAAVDISNKADQIRWSSCQNVAMSCDVAASDFGEGGRYALARNPIVAIEDPLDEDDTGGVARLTGAAGPGQ